MNETKDITLTLPVETVNACLAALVKTPYEFAQPHIEMLRSRASAALAEQNPQVTQVTQ